MKAAILHYNDATDYHLNVLDAKILLELSLCTLGSQALKLRNSCADRRAIFSATFNNAINRLVDRKLITRTKRSKYVYYNITTKGRTALEQINQHLINIAEEQIKARV